MNGRADTPDTDPVATDDADVADGSVTEDPTVIDDPLVTDHPVPEAATVDTAASVPAPTRVSLMRSGENLDHLAELEEERRFLLGSLKDLDAEHAAGDVDEDDYRTLRDGYTVRAAAVLRQIEEGRRRLAPKRRRRWGRVAAISLAVVLGAAGIGVALAQAWGERGVGDELTGGQSGLTPGDEARRVLATARLQLNEGNLPAANELFFQVVQSERDRGVDNPEALTYYAWTLALGGRANPDQEQAAQQYELALLALEQAINQDPGYADPYCFAAIVEANFREDPSAAVPFLDQCEANDPPADMADLISAFADEIRTEAAAG